MYIRLEAGESWSAVEGGPNGRRELGAIAAGTGLIVGPGEVVDAEGFVDLRVSALRTSDTGF